MVEYDTKMAVSSSKAEEAPVVEATPEIEERRGKFRIRKGGRLLKFDTKEAAEKALKE